MIPESHEVFEHGNREFDRVYAKHARVNVFLLGMVAGAVLMLLLEVLL